MYQDQTYEQILQRMLARVRSGFDKGEGSLLWYAMASAALEAHLLKIEQDDIMDEAFMDSASREFAIRRAAERGVIPRAATHAILKGEFSPTTVDVTERRFSMPGTALTYMVQEQTEPGVYRVQCEQPGAEGNRFLGNILPLGGSVPGLQSAKLTEVLIAGEDVESTDSIKQRYFSTFDGISFGGNIQDYKERINAIPGVGGVKITPHWQGEGTVRATIINSMDYGAASSGLVDVVQEIIDPTQDQRGLGAAPIGANVTITSATDLPIHLVTQITFESGFDWPMVRPGVMSQLVDYFLELRQSWEAQDPLEDYGLINSPLLVLISQVNARILSVQGVADVGGTEINGSNDNFAVERYSVPTFGSVNGEGMV